MLRIHFTDEDLVRTTLVAEPDPGWEVLLSLHMLQVADGAVPYGVWRQRLRRRLPRQLTSLLTALAPPVGYSPDFLTPSTESSEIGGTLDLILSAPRQRLRTELSMLPAQRMGSSWVRQLADGDAEAMNLLGQLLRRYYRSALLPYWSSIKTAVHADHRGRLDTLATGGNAAVLAGIHPQARWRGNILEIDALQDQDLRLEGRGLRLQPSYFCWSQPTKLRDPELPPVLVFPLGITTGLARAGSPEETIAKLAALLGVTRANVLALAAAGALTTTELAVLCGISVATVSHHTSVLRDARLLVSARRGQSVVHKATDLGRALIEGVDPW